MKLVKILFLAFIIIMSLFVSMVSAETSIEYIEGVVEEVETVLDTAQDFYNEIEDISESLVSPEVGFSTNNDGSAMYKIMADTFGIMQKFVETLTEDLSQELKPLLKIILSIYIFFLIIRTIQTGKFDIIKNFQFIGAVLLAITIVLNPTLFNQWIYQPIVGTSMKTAAYILEVSSGEVIKTEDPLQGALDIVQQHVFTASEVAETMVKAAEKKTGLLSLGLSWELIKAIILGGILTLAYFILMFVFGVIYTLGVVAMHILLICAPVAILMGSVPTIRGIFFNWLKAISTFALIPVFASIAMGATLFMLAETSAEASQYLVAVNEAGVGAAIDQPQGLYTKMLLLAMFSIFFHLKSSEFASMLVGGPITNFGQTFGLAMASGMGVAKLGIKPVAHVTGVNKVGAAIVSRTEGAAGVGLKQAGRAMSSAAGQAYQKLRK